jgi:hypothetical protein
MPGLFIARPSKIYPNRDFWFENKPSGNPDLILSQGMQTFKKALVVAVPKTVNKPN